MSVSFGIRFKMRQCFGRALQSMQLPRFRSKMALGCCASSLLVFIMLITAFAYNQGYLSLNNAKDAGSTMSTRPSQLEPSLVFKAPLNKDLYHVVTAASSAEFRPLLKLIDSLKKHASGFELLVWSLDLRACELDFLYRLAIPFKITVNEFPFHFHALHIRSFHMNALKPIILDNGAKTFGQLLWIDPTSVVSKDPMTLTDRLTNTGFVVSAQNTSSMSVCTGQVVGFNYLSTPYEKLLKPWAECAKSRPCILSYMNKTRQGIHPLLNAHVAKAKLRCVPTDTVVRARSYDGDHSLTLARWKTAEPSLCSRRKGCVLTGSHQSHGCLTPQLVRLRRNKQKYTDHHGYVYIEETHGFHRHAPCHRVWNKVI